MDFPHNTQFCWYAHHILYFKCTSASREEEGVHSIFRLHNFLYPVDITVEDSPPLSSFPWIKPSNFIHAMARNNDIGHLLGGYSLEQSEERLTNFWLHYRRLFPQHELWKEIDSGRKPVSRCLPVLLHGDEGISFKRNGLLVLSFQSFFGEGSSKTRSKQKHPDRLPLNFVQTGYQTRMLICVVPKECVHGCVGSIIVFHMVPIGV